MNADLYYIMMGGVLAFGLFVLIAGPLDDHFKKQDAARKKQPH
jgi:hypothetical protein